MSVRYLLVGTFNTNRVFSLAFDSEVGTLEVAATNEGQAPHSWLALNVRHSVHSPAWRERLYEPLHARRKRRTVCTQLLGQPPLASPVTRLRGTMPVCPSYGT